MGEIQLSWDATRKYVKYFNAQDLDKILNLLDESVISSRQNVPGVCVGPRAIRTRLTKLWSGAPKKKKARCITALCGLVDISHDGFVPCVTLLNHQKIISFILLEVNSQVEISLHTEITKKSAFTKLKFCCPHQKFPTPDTRICPNRCHFEEAALGTERINMTDMGTEFIGQS